MMCEEGNRKRAKPGITESGRLLQRAGPGPVRLRAGNYGRELRAMKGDDALATILLASPIASEGISPLTTRQFWNLVEQIGKPGRLLGMTEEDMVALGLGMDMASRVVGLLARATAMAFEPERLDQSGIATLTLFDHTYPKRFRTNLGPKAPPILHAAGALDLLNEGGVGVVGSRNVSDEGAKVATALGRQAASLNVPLISGAARGVDQLAMNAALRGRRTRNQHPRPPHGTFPLRRWTDVVIKTSFSGRDRHWSRVD